MLSTRNGPRSLFSDLLKHIPTQAVLRSNICAFRLRRKCDCGDGISISSNEFAFTFVPSGQELRGWSGTDKTGVRDSSETDTRDVAGRGVDSCKSEKVDAVSKTVYKHLK